MRRRSFACDKFGDKCVPNQEIENKGEMLMERFLSRGSHAGDGGRQIIHLERRIK